MKQAQNLCFWHRLIHDSSWYANVDFWSDFHHSSLRTPAAHNFCTWTPSPAMLDTDSILSNQLSLTRIISSSTLCHFCRPEMKENFSVLDRKTRRYRKKNCLQERKVSSQLHSKRLILAQPKLKLQILDRLPSSLRRLTARTHGPVFDYFGWLSPREMSCNKIYLLTYSHK